MYFSHWRASVSCNLLCSGYLWFLSFTKERFPSHLFLIEEVCYNSFLLCLLPSSAEKFCFFSRTKTKFRAGQGEMFCTLIVFFNYSLTKTVNFNSFSYCILNHLDRGLPEEKDSLSSRKIRAGQDAHSRRWLFWSYRCCSWLGHYVIYLCIYLFK